MGRGGEVYFKLIVQVCFVFSVSDLVSFTLEFFSNLNPRGGGEVAGGLVTLEHARDYFRTRDTKLCCNFGRLER